MVGRGLLADAIREKGGAHDPNPPLGEAPILRALGVGASRRLPRSTAQWAAATQPVDEAQLQRGDLVFFNTTGRAFSHMGIFVGAGQFVHAPSSGGTVRKDAVDGRYFGPRYLGGRSVFSG